MADTVSIPWESQDAFSLTAGLLPAPCGHSGGASLPPGNCRASVHTPDGGGRGVGCANAKC